jgi:hypothetical protein
MTQEHREHACNLKLSKENMIQADPKETASRAST